MKRCFDVGLLYYYVRVIVREPVGRDYMAASYLGTDDVRWSSVRTAHSSSGRTKRLYAVRVILLLHAGYNNIIYVRFE